MGCNCGGSTPRTQGAPQELQTRRESPARGQGPPRRRTGGPGTPEYYWNGPTRGPAQPAEPEADSPVTAE